MLVKLLDFSLRRLRDSKPPRELRIAVTESGPSRSEEHTSELQSRRDLVCRLLLEKKKASYVSFPTFTLRPGWSTPAPFTTVTLFFFIRYSTPFEFWSLTLRERCIATP